MGVATFCAFVEAVAGGLACDEGCETCGVPEVVADLRAVFSAVARRLEKRPLGVDNAGVPLIL